MKKDDNDDDDDEEIDGEWVETLFDVNGFFYNTIITENIHETSDSWILKQFFILKI